MNETHDVRLPEDGKSVFDEPWQARAFAMAVSLSRDGLFAWEEFATALGAEINRRGADEPYYNCWLSALESLLDGRRLADRGDVAGLAKRMATIPAGHHHHDHDDHPPRHKARPVAIA
ncbi:nitrile hydratase accessory protein [Mesorhizobium comanense]|uniref:nitrile hydratase accessory protein n=1 Tax=Mesorhizobium comanense TaxID=2502215 RepID=UPI0010F44DAF|nr:nitrile hydratase accessory protein [Mesorhizobium comanense]